MDAHAKNFALLHEPGRRIRSSLRYDVLPTRLDDTLTDELAYRICDTTTLEEITAEDIDLFLNTIGISSATGRQGFPGNTPQRSRTILPGQLDRLGGDGQKPFVDLIASNIRTLLGALDIEVPDPARNRDTYIARGGGWLLS